MVTRSPIRECDKETDGSPKFPSYPYGGMPRSQTPVVSCPLALAHAGLLPSGACKPSAFLSVPPGEISFCPRLYTFRGSITRPASSLTPASYAHCWAGTWSALLTCWRGVRQVGLEPYRLAPTGEQQPVSWDRSQFQGFGLTLARPVPGSPRLHSDAGAYRGFRTRMCRK